MGVGAWLSKSKKENSLRHGHHWFTNYFNVDYFRQKRTSSSTGFSDSYFDASLSSHCPSICLLVWTTWMYLLLSEGSSELCACGDSSVFQVRNENSGRGQICKLACLNLCEVRDNAIDNFFCRRKSEHGWSNWMVSWDDSKLWPVTCNMCNR